LPARPYFFELRPSLGPFNKLLALSVKSRQTTH